MANAKRLVTVTFLVSMMLLAPIAGAVGAAGDEGVEATTLSHDSDDEIIQLNESKHVSMWNHAPIALEPDSDAASVSVEIPALFAETPEYDGWLNQKSVNVYESGTEVTLTFGGGDDVDATAFEQDVQVVRGYLNESGVDDVNRSALSAMNSESMQELSEDDLDNLNENITFEASEENYSLEDGSFDYHDTPEDPGVYAYIVATEELAVDDGNITSVTDTTIFGIQQLIAHEEPSDVTVKTDSPEPGDNITFDVEATALNDVDDVNHAIVLYDEDEFTTNEITFNTTEDLNNLSAEDVTIEHPFIGGDELVEAIVDRTGFDDATVKSTNQAYLNASATALVGDASEEISVDTFENWSETDYRWVHVATGNSSDEIQVSSETLKIGSDDDDGDDDKGSSPSPSPSPSPPGDNDPDHAAPSASIAIDPNPAMVGEEITFSGAKSTDDEWDINGYEWEIDGESYSGKTVTKTFDEPGTYDVELTVSNVVGESDTVTDTVTVEKDSDGDGDAGDGKDGDGSDAGDDDDADDGGADDGDDGDGGDGDGDDGVLPIPGFGVTVAIAALLAVAMLALRTQD